MSEDLAARVSAICRKYGADAGRMIDITRAVQSEFGCVSTEAVGIISALTGETLADVKSCVSTQKGPICRSTLSKSGRPDLNRGPLRPERSALPD